ncbi:MAG TPA: choice-of-anchor L domain-containing protein [Ferruginibacter sp.]|nr:choice-of-anchor L domain-containing protein [Ferruginibacter sp.]
MKQVFLHSFFLLYIIFIPGTGIAQLQVTGSIPANQLAQTLTGDGVQVFNARFTGSPLMTGIFQNLQERSFDIDSGIVLTTGRATTGRGEIGLTSRNSSAAVNLLADNGWGLPGDADLANEIRTNLTDLSDACVLEFDFIPIGDSISFRYVFSSEEYNPSFVCTFNDAFAFFISGPGIAGQQNIALVPGTNTPVTILNVNNVPGVNCNNNRNYYVNNNSNRHFTHDGHTTVLKAVFPVTRCATYHLKLVISDVVDDAYDSGVFLEAKSLTSSNITLAANTKTDPDGAPYLAEGCGSRKLTIRQPKSMTEPVNVVLQYSGTAVNGTDVQLLPAQVTIPAGDTATEVDIIPLSDNIVEGTETLKITALYNCNNNSLVQNDSMEILLRDYDILGLKPDTAAICGSQTVQLIAEAGYTTYQWGNGASLNDATIRDPVGSPIADVTNYLCIAENGSCRAIDSVLVIKKKPVIISQNNTTCGNSSDGAITVSANAGWEYPAAFSLNNTAFTGDSIFNALVKGNYVIRVRDAAGCTDSLPVFIDQKNPDPQISSVAVSAATCSGLPDGIASIILAGGTAPFSLSLDNNSFTVKDSFHLFNGNYTVFVKDAAGCVGLPGNFTIPFVNSLRVNIIADTTICEGQTLLLTTESSAGSYSWVPAAGLDNSSSQNPLSAPVSDTKYILTATKGTCTGYDSVNITVNKAPVPNAGSDINICYNTTTVLNGNGGQTYKWKDPLLLSNDSISSPVTKALIADTYFSLQVTDDKGCSSLTADSVLVTVRPPALISAGNDTIVAVNQPLRLLAIDINNSGFSSFTWSPAEGLSDPFIASPIAINTRESITYTVMAETAEGCNSSASIKVKTYTGPEIYVASAFTPNNDAINNELHVTTAGIKTLRYFTICNRWGQVVFTSSGNNYPVWDGTLKGKLVAPGTYVWIAEAVGYRGNVFQRKGTVMVLY